METKLEKEKEEAGTNIIFSVVILTGLYNSHGKRDMITCTAAYVSHSLKHTCAYVHLSYGFSWDSKRERDKGILNGRISYLPLSHTALIRRREKSVAFILALEHEVATVQLLHCYVDNKVTVWPSPVPFFPHLILQRPIYV